MSEVGTEIVWERSDQLLSGATVFVRGVGVPQEGELRGAVAVTLQIQASQCQVSDSGVVTATLLIAPEEAIGVSRWLREAAQSLDKVPPLFEWEAGEGDKTT